MADIFCKQSLMSVHRLKSGSTGKYSIWFREFPRPHAGISLYSPPLVYVQTQYIMLQCNTMHYSTIKLQTIGNMPWNLHRNLQPCLHCNEGYISWHVIVSLRCFLIIFTYPLTEELKNEKCQKNIHFTFLTVVMDRCQ